TFNSIKYIIQHDELIIKSGFFTNKRIKITSIRKIVETTNIISAPAASFDRLEIIYNTYDSIEISPSNKQNFIDDLLAIHSNIEIKYKTPQYRSLYFYTVPSYYLNTFGIMHFVRQFF